MADEYRLGDELDTEVFVASPAFSTSVRTSTESAASTKGRSVNFAADA